MCISDTWRSPRQNLPKSNALRQSMATTEDALLASHRCKQHDLTTKNIIKQSRHCVAACTGTAAGRAAEHTAAALHAAPHQGHHQRPAAQEAGPHCLLPAVRAAAARLQVRRLPLLCPSAYHLQPLSYPLLSANLCYQLCSLL